MAFSKLSTPQFDKDDPRPLQTFGTQVRDAVNSVVGALSEATEAVKLKSATSAAGFKCVVGPATYANAAYPGGIVVGQIQASTGAISFGWVAPFAGSVIGMSARISSVAATTDFYVYKSPANGTPVQLWLTSGIIASANTDGYATAPKGRYAFVAGDRLQIRFAWSANPLNLTAIGHLVVEMDA